MLKSIFCKIISDKQEGKKLNSLKDKNEIYKLFCENGYKKSYNKFEEEIKAFLNSEDSKNLINNNFDELSDDMLEMVAGGLSAKQAVTSGIATLLITFTIGAIGSQILSQNKTDTAPIISQSTSPFSNDNTEQTNDNNDEQAKDDKIDENKPDGPQKMNNRRGPIKPGSGPIDHRKGPNDGPGGNHGGSFRNNTPDGLVLGGNNFASQEKQQYMQDTNEIITNDTSHWNKEQKVQKGANKLADTLQNKINDNNKTAMKNIKSAAKEEKQKETEAMKNANKANKEIVEKHEQITQTRKECEQKHKEVKKLSKELDQKLPLGVKEDLKSKVREFLKQDPRELSQEQIQNYLQNAKKIINQMNKIIKK